MSDPFAVLVQDNDSADQTNRDGEDYTDEEEDEESYESNLTVKVAKEEDKAGEARTKLRICKERNEAIPLHNISGKWELFSSAYLDAVIKAEDDGYPVTDLENNELGELRIGSEYPKNTFHHASSDLGAQFHSYGNEFISPFFDFKTPEHALLSPLVIDNVWDFKTEDCYTVHLFLLGSGVLELHVPNHRVPEIFQTAGDVVFVGVQSKTEAELEEEREEVSNEWRDCKYTGHWHPDNWKREYYY